VALQLHNHSAISLDVGPSRPRTFAMTQETESLEQRITDYLRQHPQAGDTLEGIARWWLLRQQVHDSLRSVERALEGLKLEGLVKERRTPGGQRLYFFSGDQR
jgi:hypothetical protein